MVKESKVDKGGMEGLEARLAAMATMVVVETIAVDTVPIQVDRP